jgi:hypothetical protein
MSAPNVTVYKEPWTTETIEFLQAAARAHMFDFNKVANAMNAHFSEKNVDGIICNVTELECRKAYTEVLLPPIDVEAFNKKLCEVSSKLTDINVDEMSVQEIMETLELRQEENEKMKERIFNRVLESLGPSTHAEAFQESPAYSIMKSNILERKRQKEADAVKAEKVAKEAEDRKWIEQERERLRRRHHPDSEDAQGIDPIIGQQYSSNGPDADTETDTDTDTHQTDLDNQADLSFNIEAVMANEHFNRLLEEIEKEVESRADEKEISKS